MGGEAPEVIAGSPEARLDFIGHAQSPSRTDLLECRGEVARGRNQDAIAGEDQVEKAVGAKPAAARDATASSMHAA